MRELVGVRLPFAMPALFAASKIALPAAISGALLAEWLATGNGLGSLMLRASASSKFAIVWSGAVVIVIVSIAAYSLVGTIESASPAVSAAAADRAGPVSAIGGSASVGRGTRAP